jgi:PAS domain S-box-containing protein
LRSKFLLLGFAGAVIVGAVIGLRGHHDAQYADAAASSIAHTRTVMQILDQVRTDTFSIITELLGYSRSRDSKSLGRLPELVARLRHESAELLALKGNDSFEQKRFLEADRSLRRVAKLASNVVQDARTTSLRSTSLTSFVEALVQFRVETTAIALRETRVLAERTTDARLTSRRQSLTEMEVGAGGVILWLLLFGGYASLSAGRLRETSQALVISRQQLARSAEREHAEKKFRALIESVAAAIVIVDRGGSIVLVNAQTEKLFDYTRAELLGSPIEMLMPARLRERHEQHRTGYFADPKLRPMGLGLELLALGRDGREFPVEISLSPLETEQGTLVSAAIRDVSEHKRIELEMRALSESARRHATELEAVNRELETFSFSVSHDLRAPLRSIDGFSLALIEDYADKLEPEAREYLQRIRAATQRMGNLIDDLLTLSRIARDEMRDEVFDLSALVNTILAELREADPGRKVECVVANGIAARGDPRLLRTALENLLGNAWKFTAKKQSARIEFGVSQPNGQPIYFVRDDGAGFDMRYAAKLFGAFQRLHSGAEFPGTGIGLASVQRVVLRHGGRIWAEAAVDKGTTISFTLHDTRGDAREQKNDAAGGRQSG